MVEVHRDGGGVAGFGGDPAGLGHVPAADGDGEGGLQPAQRARCPRSDDTGSANDEDWCVCHVGSLLD
jgi:hypothetical protein